MVFGNSNIVRKLARTRGSSGDANIGKGDRIGNSDRKLGKLRGSSEYSDID